MGIFFFYKLKLTPEVLGEPWPGEPTWRCDIFQQSHRYRRPPGQTGRRRAENRPHEKGQDGETCRKHEKEVALI